MPLPRLIAVLSCLDPLLGTGSEDYTKGAVLPALWDGGWEALYAYHNVDHLFSTLGVARFCLYAPWGLYATTSAKTIGYGPSQVAVTSRFLGPRQAETDLLDSRLVSGVADTGLPGFSTYWAGIVANFVSQGGEVMCYQGAPPFVTGRDAMTIDNWVAEPETCNMSLALDKVAGTDRLSYPTAASVLADRLLLRNRRLYVSQHELIDPRLTGWYRNPTQAISGKTRADLAVASPGSYNSPPSGRESVVTILASDIADPAARVQAALGYFGTYLNGSPWTVAAEVRGMTDAQIAQLLEAGAA